MVPSGELLAAFRLPLAPNIEGVGVLPYTFLNGKIYILMGQEIKTNKLISFGLTDFRKEKDLFEEIAQSLYESSRGIFGNTTEMITRLRYSPALIRGTLAIIFLQINPELRSTARNNFLTTKPTSRQDISDLRWVSLGNLKKLMSGEKKGMKSTLRDVLILPGFDVIKSGLVSMTNSE